MIKWYRCKDCGKDFRRIFELYTREPDHCLHCGSKKIEPISYKERMNEYLRIVGRGK